MGISDSDQQASPERRRHRRALLRAALVGAGAAALGRDMRRSEADSGDPLLIGRSNTSQGDGTRLVSNGQTATLSLRNSGGTALDAWSRTYHAYAVHAHGPIRIDDAQLEIVGPRAGIRVAGAPYSALYATSGGKEPTVDARNVTAQGPALQGFARRAKDDYGVALAVVGSMSARSAGVVDIAEGDRQVVVTMPKGLAFSISVVLATVQGPSTVGVLWAKADDENHVTVRLTGPAPAGTRIGIFIVNPT